MTLTEMLTEAQAAYHQLMTGRSVVEVTDQNGERVRYTAVSASNLRAYIADLKNQIAAAAGAPVGPMSIWGRG